MFQLLVKKADILDIEIEQQSVWNPIVTLKDEDGDPVILTDYEIVFEIKSSFTCYEQTLATYSTGNGGIVITDAVNGEFQITIPSADTADFTFGSGVHNLFMTPPGEDQERVWYGKITIIPS